jgi:MurNAc alpha-1-phosphate uridylyltransferase
MKALIFAAGRGERMRPLSDTLPKPLLTAGGRMLIEWQIAALRAAGIRDVVVNTAHLSPLLEERLGDGRRQGVTLHYSREGTCAEDALETLGGIVRALPLLGDEPFVAVSGDIVCEYDYRALRRYAADLAAGRLDAHLVLVPNPPFHPRGDMGLAGGLITVDAPWFTYGNIALLAPHLFRDEAPGRKKLFPWLLRFAQAGRVGGELFDGRWYNVGTPDDLQQLDATLRAAPLRLAGDYGA